MTFLFRRAALFAAVEATFRTDQVPTGDTPSFPGIDSTTDVNDGTEEITIASHGFQTGDGPVRLTIDSGLLPTPLLIDTDYWIITIDANTIQLATSIQNAAAGTAIDITAAVGTFTLFKVQSDAFLVEEPDFAPDITVVERNNVRVTLSPEPLVVARKIATVTFAHEIRSNSIIDGSVSPRMGVLLRGCAMAETLFGETGNEVETILEDAAIPINFPDGTFTYTKTNGFAGTLPRVVILTCTTPGGSGVAQFTNFSPLVGNAASPVQPEIRLDAQTMTDATAYPLLNVTPSADAEITPTIGADFAVGDTFVITVAPVGHFYQPISDAIESLTIYLFFGDSTGGVRHRLTGCRGTFTAEGEAADFGRFNFTFTGDWIDPDDSPLPANPEFETTLPPPIELANLIALGGQDFDPDSPTPVNLCAQSFSVDIANNVVARTCINAPESVEGAVITGRSPVGAFNPEVEQESDAPFWGLLSSGDLIFWNVRVGKTQGNVVTFTAPQAQYSEIAYGNRDDIRIYDVTTALRTLGADDELRIVFS